MKNVFYNQSRSSQIHDDGHTPEAPEYLAQRRASLDYFEHIGDVLDKKVRLARLKMSLYDTPKSFIESEHDDGSKDILTYDKHFYEDQKGGPNKVKLVEKSKIHKDIVEAVKEAVRRGEAEIRALEVNFGEQQNYSNKGFEPESLEVIRVKYGLDIPFPPDTDNDYFNEDNASSWSIYEEKLRELENEEYRLQELENPTTRAGALRYIEKQRGISNGSILDKGLLKQAVEIVVDNNKANTSILQSRLRVTYRAAVRMLGEMEKLGIVSRDNDSLRPRKVLINASEITDKLNQ